MSFQTNYIPTYQIYETLTMNLHKKYILQNTDCHWTLWYLARTFD